MLDGPLLTSTPPVLFDSTVANAALPPASAPTKAEPNESGMARIWFFRTKSMTDSARNPTIYSQGIPIAKIEKGQFFGIIVEPGTYYFSWTDRPKANEQASVTIKASEQDFFQTRWRSIIPVDTATWNRELPGLKAIEGKNVFDRRFFGQWADNKPRY